MVAKSSKKKNRPRESDSGGFTAAPFGGVSHEWWRIQRCFGVARGLSIREPKTSTLREIDALHIQKSWTRGMTWFCTDLGGEKQQADDLVVQIRMLTTE
jgi:hypothetical protein